MRRKSTKTIKNLQWGRIIFGSKYAITVETSTITTVFHRYGAPRGSYAESWHPFCQALRRNRLDNVFEIYKLAESYGVEHFAKSIKTPVEVPDER